MMTWKATNNVMACIFYTKNDEAKKCCYLTRSCQVLLPDRTRQKSITTWYRTWQIHSDDKAIIFNNCEDLTNSVNNIATYFAWFVMEVHRGRIEPRGESKTKILFCSKPCPTCNNPDSYDADLSDVINHHDPYIPFVDHFSYLGSIISTNCIDNNDVEVRIRKIGSAFGA